MTPTAFKQYLDSELCNIKGIVLDAEIFTGTFDPAMYLAEVLTHLADHKPMTASDESAWWIVKNLQDCFFAGMTDECVSCGKMEGLHGNFTNLCPDMKGTFTKPFEREYGQAHERWLESRGGCFQED